MAGSSRSKHKPKLEPISLEELAGTTGMSGFCSFLAKPASVYARESEAPTLSGTPTLSETPSLSGSHPDAFASAAAAAAPAREADRTGSESHRVSEQPRVSEP